MRAQALVLSVLLVAAPALAADAPRHSHRAHQHGAARLHVSLDGRALHIALEGPADSFLGFEHAPRTQAHKETVARVEQQLRQTQALFTTSPAADCRPEPAQVDLKLPPPGSRETHSEIAVEWRWACTRPESLVHVDVGLFRAFPRLKQLRAEVVTAARQTTAVLRPNAARLALAS